jgi:hypothetical protein
MDDKDAGGKLFAGYRFTPFVALYPMGPFTTPRNDPDFFSLSVVYRF